MSTEKTCKILLNAMVANESNTIIRMLESCYRYIDFWVIQDNGSTDNTPELIQNFMDEKKIPGMLYKTAWQYPGFNRDHALQMCYKLNHRCDWILRMDADEQLVVDPDFDWSILNNTQIQSFNITADAGSSVYFRTWLWNAKLPWRFKHDKRHEVILLDGYGEDDEGFQRINLPKSFRHVITNDGQTWGSPHKFLSDALELEKDKIEKDSMRSDTYHLWYLAKSYSDCYGDTNSFPFGKIHSYEYARRSIFYFERYLETAHEGGFYLNEMSYLAHCLIGNAKRFMGDLESALVSYALAEIFCPERNEHLMWMSEVFDQLGDYESMYGCTSRMMNEGRKNPFPKKVFLLWNSAYHDTGDYVKHLHSIATQKTGNTTTQIEYKDEESVVLYGALGPSLKK
jgi:glycosyltransferase involved in cell wall biosynthesis